MRRLLIRFVLPTAFVSVPFLGALLIAAAIPADSRRDYLDRIQTSAIDWIIIGLGLTLFTAQTWLGWRALQWRGQSFDERPDRMLSHLAQAAEWFPLLGLLGTVAAILQTFSSIPSLPTQNGTIPPQLIIQKYAPAITATGSGLFMALMNILPTWMVQVGRELIRSLAGGRPSGEMEP